MDNRLFRFTINGRLIAAAAVYPGQDRTLLMLWFGQREIAVAVLLNDNRPASLGPGKWAW